MAAFIYNEGGSLYSSQQISEHLKDLKITKKKASIKVQAFQALYSEVQFRVYTYWNCPPLGYSRSPDKNSSILKSLG
jgi:hypothetical protein